MVINICLVLFVAYLRLGIIAQRNGLFSEATDYFKDAMGLFPDADNVSLETESSWLCLANLNFQMKALTIARKSYERIVMSPKCRHNPFALIALGNIYIKLYMQDPSNGQSTSNLKRASEFFLKALSLDESNYYAANGLGIVLALKGAYKEAQEVFFQIHQLNNGFADAWINLGHSHQELGQYAYAMNTYLRSLNIDLDESNLQYIHSLIAKCYYIIGKQDLDCNSLETAVSFLGKVKQL
jgi:tetratricopeptide (TPR) repeat protein